MSRLWYNKTPSMWEEALPIGNGRIGGMVYADACQDKIVLNEETLWSGGPEGKGVQHSMEDIEKIRTLIRNKEYDKSDPAISDFMDGDHTQLYMTLGELNIKDTTRHNRDITDYERELSLDNAVVSCKYKHKGYDYKREYFASLADDVMVIKVTGFDLFATINLDCWLECDVKYVNDTVTIVGRAPTNFFPNSFVNKFEYDENKESIPFMVEMKIFTDRFVAGMGKNIDVAGASYFTIVYSIATGFNGFDKLPQSQGKDYKKECHEKLMNALKYSYDELKQRHIDAYKKLYDRVEVCIDGDDYENVPTDVRIENVKNGVVDNKLTQLLFDYGRYLLISGSQPGGQPTTLQGIWTKDLISPWYSNYTININTQMNYWAAEQVNLPECHMPVFDMVEDFSKKGNHFGLPGWNTAHNTDIWRFNSEATKGVCWGFWEMGGFWLARHIYEHYLYTQDKAFIKKYADVLDGIYDFLTGWLTRDEYGRLTTCPSTTPENSFIYNGIVAAAAEGAAMDLSIIIDYLTYMIELSPIIGKDKEKYEKMMSEMKPLSIGSDGRLLEYGEEFEEFEPGHRHLSHLYGVYPACIIKEGTDLFEAAKKAMEGRIANNIDLCGWTYAWLVSLYSRFKDGEKANFYIKGMFKNVIFPNLFDSCPPFQIDGNYGICAGICEMLMQSHTGTIELIPAIPKEWKSGHVKGMKARGGKTVSFAWKDGKIISSEIV